MAGEDVEFEIEKRQRESRERVKSSMLAEGRPDLVVQLDRELRDVDLGLTRARNLWHSISVKQRSLLLLMMQSGSKLIWQESTSFYDLAVDSAVTHHVARLPTVRSLIARGLLSCEGGVFDPEAVVVLTESARFVVNKAGLPPKMA